MTREENQRAKVLATAGPGGRTNKDIAAGWLADMQQRLGDEAFQKLYDEVVAELKKPTASS